MKFAASPPAVADRPAAATGPSWVAETVVLAVVFAVAGVLRDAVLVRWAGGLTACAGVGLGAAAVVAWRVTRHRRARVAADAVARDAGRQLRAVVEAAPVAIYTTAADGTVRSWNAAAERVFGWSADEAVGRPLRIVPPDRAAAYAASRARVWAGYAVDDELTQGVRRDGTLVDLSVSAAPLCDAMGRVTGGVVLATDVTARVRAEAARTRAERAVAAGDARFARMTANLPGVVFQYVRRPDGSAAYPFVSRGSVELFGLTPEQFRADSSVLVRLVLPDEAGSFRGSVGRSKATLGPWQWEGRFRHATTGAVRWLSAAARPEVQADGSTVWDGVMTDVTADKAARDAAEAASRAKSDFLANMSHELRTPLNGVVGMLQLLTATPLSDDQRRYAATADASAAALLALINDVLDFSKIEAGKLVLDPVPFDVADATADAVAILAARAAAKGLAVSCVIDPAAAGRRVGPADRVRQVLVNLIGNAVKFTAAGSVTLTVTPEPAEGEDTIRFAVADTGIGIPADRIDRLFQTFSQVDTSTTRQYGGTGLGLAICRQLAGLMGGRVGVDSAVGHGSTFWFTARLPVDRTAAVPPPPAAVAVPTGRRRHVLVAEDNDVNQMVVGEMLRRLGYGCELVGNGRAAVDAVAAAGGGRFDLVLMDCQMPVMDGLEATAALRAAEVAAGTPRLPVVALTANALQGDRERCLAAGMDDYMSKPVDVRALAAKLAAWVPADPVVTRAA